MPAKLSPTGQHRLDQSLLRRHQAAAAFENECDIPNDLVVLPEPERMVSKIINVSGIADIFTCSYLFNRNVLMKLGILSLGLILSFNMMLMAIASI